MRARAWCVMRAHVCACARMYMCACACAYVCVVGARACAYVCVRAWCARTHHTGIYTSLAQLDMHVRCTMYVHRSGYYCSSATLCLVLVLRVPHKPTIMRAIEYSMQVRCTSYYVHRNWGTRAVHRSCIVLRSYIVQGT